MDTTQAFSIEDVFLLVGFVLIASAFYRQKTRRIDQKADAILQFHLRWSTAIAKEDEKARLLTKEAWHDWLIVQDMDIIRVAMTKVLQGSPATDASIESAWAQMQNMLPQLPLGIHGLEC